MTANRCRSGPVLFVDPCCPRPYAPSSIEDARLGGTEATLLKIATTLAGDAQIIVHQRHRTETVIERKVEFRPFDQARTLRGDAAHIVVINSWKVALLIRKAHPHARISLWLHVVPGKHNRTMGARLRDAGIAIVCVSESHGGMLRSFLRSGGEQLPDIHTIHNPIADHLAPDGTVRNGNLLLFASAPHKGLAEVLKSFETIRMRIPSLRLEIADPGYLAWKTGEWPDGTYPLGNLSQAKLTERMRRALCLFYPQTSFSETFGLVIAEANAVGTPALLHAGLGANSEVASTVDQCLDCTDIDAVADKITAWRHEFPAVSGQTRFTLTSVAKRWRDYLASADGPMPALNTDGKTFRSLHDPRNEAASSFQRKTQHVSWSID